MRYKPVREYRFYRNSRGGWIYKSFFSIRPSSRMQVGAISDIDNGGRSFWKKKYDRNRMNSKLHILLPVGSHRFKRVGGFWKDFHGTLFRVPTRWTLSSSIGPINISIWAKSRTNIGIFWKRDIFVLLISPITHCHFANILKFFNYYQTFVHWYIIETAEISYKYWNI